MPNEEQIKEIIRDELSQLIKTGRYVFHKPIQILDGRNIQVGLTTGTQLGTSAAQKIALHGVTPTIQSLKINDPSSAGGTYSQAQVQSIVTAVNAILDALESKGISASS